MRHLFLAAAAAFSVIAGCAVKPVSLEESSRSEGIAATHQCIGACDHFFVDGGWKVVPGHKHGPGCGHVLVDGKWVKAKGEGKPADEEPKDKADRDKDQ